MERKERGFRQGHDKSRLTECVISLFILFVKRHVMNADGLVGLDSRLCWNSRIAHVGRNVHVFDYIDVVTKDVREKLLVKTIVL